MAFVQLMDFQTSDPQGADEVLEEWTGDTSAADRVLVTRHHDDANRYCALVYFPSYETAMENSQRPETQQYAERLREKVDGEITYFDLDIVEEKQL